MARMRGYRSIAGAAALLLACTTSAFAQTAEPTPLATQIGTLLSDPKIEGAHWGISVTQLDGTPIYALNDDQLFQPESNVKLFTTAAALALLGPKFTIHTDVFAQGNLSDKTRLNGDLVLRGGGDANFGTNDVPYTEPAMRPKKSATASTTIAVIEELADKVAATGLREIDGDVVGDDQYTANEPYPPGWADDDLIWGYGAPISALSIHDNEVRISIAPIVPAPHKPINAKVSVLPDVPYYKLNNEIATEDTGSNHNCDDLMRFRREGNPGTLSLRGEIAPSIAPCAESISIDDPARYAALALKLALERRGIYITGTARSKHADINRFDEFSATEGAPDETLFTAFKASPPATPTCFDARPVEDMGTLLATHTSPLLVDDVTFTNKVSQNLHAELLLRNTESFNSCGDSIGEDNHVVRQYLLFIGLQASDFILYDGSGLSSYDLATPRAFTQLLRYAATQKWGADYKSSLPIGGIDGTLETRFTKAPLKGNVFAKTGTSSEDRALSGYVICASGKMVVFSILVGDHLPGSNADRDVMDKIVAVIAAAN
jgi:D-alanyl-D-alanine carboxypeptidase/D-alanyl-D-alanine-endopeptidase (penicillin-binding protein 4)